MPSVNVAMERSLREGAVDLLAASLRPLLDRRAGTITNSVTDVKTAFSSWDNCMQASFCKWPVIALIIIGGLIIFSILWCIIRCLCCGLSCCCECFYCLKCCGNCCGCCDTPKGTPHKYLDEPYVPPNQGYRSQAPMTAGNIAPSAAAAGPKAPAPFSPHEPPKYAEFDVSKKSSGNEDALPAMPSWEGAENKKVMMEEEAVELSQLKKPEQNMPLMTGGMGPGPASPGPMSPSHSGNPYGAPSAAASSSYVGGAQGYGQSNNGSYGQQQLDQRYDGYGAGAMAGAAGVAGAMAMGQGRRTPANPNMNPNRGYGQGGGYPGGQPYQGSYDEYRRGGPSAQGYGTDQGYGMGPSSMASRDQNNMNTPYGPGPSRSPAPHQQGGYGYGEPPRRSPAPQSEYGYGDAQRRSPAPQTDYAYGAAAAARPSPAPQQGAGYGYGDNAGYDSRPQYDQSQRQYSSESTRPLNQRAPPQRQYSSGVQSSAPTSPLQNGGGFDFNSGYSRSQAQAQEYDDGYGNSGRPQAPARQNTGGGGSAYPGYQAYQPAGSSSRAGGGQQGWSGL